METTTGSISGMCRQFASRLAVTAAGPCRQDHLSLNTIWIHWKYDICKHDMREGKKIRELLLFNRLHTCVFVLAKFYITSESQLRHQKCVKRCQRGHHGVHIISVFFTAHMHIVLLNISSAETCNRKREQLTAMWQVDVPQIIAMREAIGWSSQGKLKPFTSAPITPWKSKNADVIFHLNHI